MSYGVNSIQIHKKLRLDKRAGSDNWYARLTLPSGKRLIKTTKTDDLEAAKEVALRLYYEVDARIQNKLPATTRKFKDHDFTGCPNILARLLTTQQHSAKHSH